jgi:hypothetical protein
MVWQMYWPNWWQIWPVWRKTLDADGFGLYHNLLCIGPLQCMWWSKR